MFLPSIPSKFNISSYLIRPIRAGVGLMHLLNMVNLGLFDTTFHLADAGLLQGNITIVAFPIIYPAFTMTGH